MSYVTLPERKRARVAEMARDLTYLRERLSRYARAHGGRFVIFGSAARDALRFDSDVDILVDFPEAGHSAAWRFAEEACWDLGLKPDVRPLSYCTPEFVSCALDHGIELA